MIFGKGFGNSKGNGAARAPAFFVAGGATAHPAAAKVSAKAVWVTVHLNKVRIRHPVQNGSFGHRQTAAVARRRVIHPFRFPTANVKLRLPVPVTKTPYAGLS
jgi:hypothetical protein